MLEGTQKSNVPQSGQQPVGTPVTPTEAVASQAITSQSVSALDVPTAGFEVAAPAAPGDAAAVSMPEPNLEDISDGDETDGPSEELPEDEFPRIPRLSGAGYGARQRATRTTTDATQPLQARTQGRPSAEQKLLLLDTWNRSGLPAGEFAALLGICKHTLYSWKKRFDTFGPAGLMDAHGGKQGSRLSEITKRSIIMLKKANPEWGAQRISDMLLRGPALPASASAVARVLQEAGLATPQETPEPHNSEPKSFERARPNQLWQTDLFHLTLKRQNRRIYLVAFMDDHSRFIVSYGLYATPSTALVLEALMAGIANYGAPEEILTDNGPQYATWRGKSAFTKELEKRGIRQIIARPKRPQTLGKIERFWGTLWRELLQSETFIDIEDARKRIGLFIDHYNFQRTHQGIKPEGQVPADRFFGAAPDMLRTLKERVAANALELARHGVPQKPFYMVGQFGENGFSVHTEGERVILTRAGQREELAMDSHKAQEVLAKLPPKPQTQDLPQPLAPHGAPQSSGPEGGSEQPPPPGVSPIDSLIPGLSPRKPQDGGEA